MTTQELKLQTRKQLADLARDQGISGWHAMKKDDLINKLARRFRNLAKSAPRNIQADLPNSRTSIKTKSQDNNFVRRPVSSGPVRTKARPQFKSAVQPQAEDVLQAEICNSYWVKLSWELSSKTLSRAESALGAEWMRSKPIIRTFELFESDDSDKRNRALDLEISGDAESWFVQVEKPGKRYQFVLGYLAPSGRFFTLAKSPAVTAPKPGAQGSMERTYSTSPTYTGGKEYRVGDSNVWRIGEYNAQKTDALKLAYTSQRSLQTGEGTEYRFNLEAEIVVHGITQPGSGLTVHGEPVGLREDGSFSVRYSLPNGRHVIPFVSVCQYTGDHHTQILALERNTKELEVLTRDEL